MKRLTRTLAPVLLAAGLLGGSVAVAPTAMARPVIEEPSYGCGPSLVWNSYLGKCVRPWGPKGGSVEPQATSVPAAAQPAPPSLTVQAAGWDWWCPGQFRIGPWEECKSGVKGRW